MGDLISDALSKIMNAERVNKREVTIKHTSKLLNNIIKIIKDNGYISDFKVNDNSITIKLNNKINKIGSIRPRYPCTVPEIEGYEKRYLPAAGFGIIIISTSNGLMTHYDAKKKGIGGTLIAYCY